MGRFLSAHHTHLSPIVHNCPPINLPLFPNENILIPDETYCWYYYIPMSRGVLAKVLYNYLLSHHRKRLVPERVPELATFPGDVVHGAVLGLAVRLPPGSQSHQRQLAA